MLIREAQMTSCAHFGCQLVTEYGNNSTVNFLSNNIIMHCLLGNGRSWFKDKSIVKSLRYISGCFIVYIICFYLDI